MQAKLGKDTFSCEKEKGKLKDVILVGSYRCKASKYWLYLEYRFLWGGLFRSDLWSMKAAVHQYDHVVSPLTADSLKGSCWGF